MKYLYLFSIMLFQSFSGISQVNISAQVPSSGLVQKQQLWNLVIVNTNDELLECKLLMSIQEPSSGQVMLTAETGSFSFTKGTRVLTESSLQPIQYQYNHPDMSRNFLPLGSFIVCYRLIDANGKERSLAEECIALQIDPLSPIMLSSPPDLSTIFSTYPLLTWIPPTPIDMFSGLSYLLQVCELKEGQKPIDAIMENIPVYTRGSLTQPNDQMVGSFKALETGKTYAWQVTAVNGSQFASKSEIWSFKVVKDDLNMKIVEQSPFLRLKKWDIETGIAPNGFLKLAYRNELNDTTAQLQIFSTDVSRQKLGEVKLKLTTGENLLIEKIQEKLKLQDGIQYRAVVINSANESWQIFFSIKKYTINLKQ